MARDETRSDALEVTTAAVHRATGTSLGSICLGSLIVAIVRLAGRAAAEMKRITSPRSNILPGPLMFISKATPLFAIVAGLLDQLNGYALVYVGITGDAFWPSARRAVSLAGRRKGGHLLDCKLFSCIRYQKLINRHINQAPPHAQFDSYGFIHRYSRIPIHGPLSIKSRLGYLGSSTLRRSALLSYQSRSFRSR